MREFIARLIKCGFSRDIAVCVVRTYMRDKDVNGLRRYVNAIEEETKYREEQVL